MVDTMQSEVSTFSDVEGARTAKEAARHDLEKQRAVLTANYDALKVSQLVIAVSMMDNFCFMQAQLVCGLLGTAALRIAIVLVANASTIQFTRRVHMSFATNVE